MRSLALCVGVLLLTAASASAQFDTATVVGTVRDASESVIPGAKVTLTAIETGISTVRVSADDGNYEFPAVKPGTYVVTAEKTGFAVALVDQVQVQVGARLRVDLKMPVGQVSEKVEVKATQPLVETDTSQRGQVISGEQIRALPLISREYSALALLSTGVKLAGSSLTTGNTPREGAFNVNGLRSTVNNFLIDGIDNNAYGTSNQGFSNQVMQPPPDAITEFKVVTNNMSAEYGRAAGATINVNYRSGTNTLHGSVWEFLRDDSLNATGFFRPATGKPIARSPPVRRRVRRPAGPQSRVLLRRLRGAAADPAGDRVRVDRDARPAPGDPRRRRARPAQRRDLSGGHGGADDRLRPPGAVGDCPTPISRGTPTTTPRSRSSPRTRTRGAPRSTCS